MKLARGIQDSPGTVIRFMELFRALGALAEPPAREHRNLTALFGLGRPPTEATHTDLFLFQLYPYASVYLGAEGMVGGEARDRIAGFWRVLGETPPAEPDHLSVLLSVYAHLVEREGEAEVAGRREGWRNVRTAFLWEHLLSWLPVFLDKVDEIGCGFYRRWSTVLQAALREEAVATGEPEILPLHLREAPELEDPHRVGGKVFLGELLSPVRSGILLVRSDLERAARELELAVRIGERRFVLEALFAQDPTSTLDWLAKEAERWEERHRQRGSPLERISGFWAERAAAAAALIRGLRESV
jgi:TorA maturation chaperone TorD